MVSEMVVKFELAVLLLEDKGPEREHHITHREGRIRALVYVLTGQDIGAMCGYYNAVKKICDLLGWGCKTCGESGWEIDFKGQVDEALLSQRHGVTVVPNDIPGKQEHDAAS